MRNKGKIPQHKTFKAEKCFKTQLECWTYKQCTKGIEAMNYRYPHQKNILKLFLNTVIKCCCESNVKICSKRIWSLKLIFGHYFFFQCHGIIILKSNIISYVTPMFA